MPSSPKPQVCAPAATPDLEAAGLPLAQLLAGDVVRAAAGLVGCVLERRLPDGRVIHVQLVELEAYHQREPGCHAYRGMTERTRVMFGPPGSLYVYFTYGMWHCANIVCEADGCAAAVLIRAAVPYAPHGGAGVDAAQQAAALRLSGPGLICQALELDRRCSGMLLQLDGDQQASGTGDSASGSVRLYRPEGFIPPPLAWSTRVGFSFQDTLPWRCYWAGHPGVGKVSLKPLKRKPRG
ncbi:DNA-3-methyladenine glycosylase [bacterium]|nr:DNA-3-methyladenine glycosylase [bacterium]